MPVPETYLDWAATTPPDAECLTRGLETAFRHYANPSSNHGPGKEAASLLGESRSNILRVLGGSGGLVFTGSGSEADHIALLSPLCGASWFALAAGRSKEDRPHILASAIEHPAIEHQLTVLERSGFAVTRVRPEPDGIVDPWHFVSLIRPATVFATVMTVNNETGAIQNVEKIASILKEIAADSGSRTVHFHSDAVQAFGKIPFEPGRWGLDSAAICAHKLRGPKGIGGLWFAKPFPVFVTGGSQEAGMRPGTENLQSIVAFAESATKAIATREDSFAHARELEARLFAGVRAIPGAGVLPECRHPGDPRYSPYIVSLAFPGLSGEVLQRSLAERSIAVSTGSACSSRQRQRSRRILDAMGVEPDLALSAIRVSTGSLTTAQEIDRFLEAASDLYTILKPARGQR